MRKEVKIIVVSLALSIFLINLISASFGFGNESYSLDLYYAPDENIVGWINISIEDEPADSEITAFDDNISLVQFLEDNSANYSCFPSDCQTSYSVEGSPSLSKSFSITPPQGKVIGLKLTGSIEDIISLKFDIDTNAGQACFNPLKIDILNDGIIDWKANKLTSDNSCYMYNPYGCYRESDYVSGNEFLVTESQTYCNKVNLPPYRGFKLGANITKISGSNPASFDLSITTSSYSKTCTANTIVNGAASCNIEFEDDEGGFVEADICIQANDLQGGEYEIKYEDIDACGYIGETNYDFPIFAGPRKYAGLSDFGFNQTLVNDNLASIIAEYVSNKYENNCDPECVIPIGFSGASQDITLSNMDLRYGIPGIKSEKNMYDIQESEATINSGFNKLDLDLAEFAVSSTFGDQDFVLRLNGEILVDEEISVLNVPKITSITPFEASVLVPQLFKVTLGNTLGNITYRWDFGDGGIETTDERVVQYTYETLGDYDLKVTVINKFGNTSKTVKIKVGAPSLHINDTIDEYLDRLNDIQSEIDQSPGFVKDSLKTLTDIENLKSDFDIQKKKYEECQSTELCSEEEYTAIMNEILELGISDKLDISQKIGPNRHFPDPMQINLGALEYFGAGAIDKSEEEYTTAVSNWFMENLEMTIESKTYSLYQGGNIEDVLSYTKVTLLPKEEGYPNEVYFIVNGYPEDIKVNSAEEPQEYDDAWVVIFPDLAQSQTIEIITPGKIHPGDLPVYLSPDFVELPFEFEVGPCNFNEKCEKSLGENWKNCRDDCKPWGWIIFILCIVLFIAFVAYIILQEWYKRYYQAHLFPKKNQLFNLINFMHISETQGLKKSQIFKKLKAYGWTSEQLRFAWNKLHGKRTGMWEIPIFKWVEKKEVKRELKKRKGLGNYPPKQFRK